MTGQRIWVNGLEGTSGLVPDEGFFFGRGVFETMHVTKRALFLQEHLARLTEGASRLGIKRSLTAGEVEQVISDHSLSDCALKVTITPENIVITTRPVPYGKELLKSGVTVMMGAGRRNACSRITGAKTTSYADSLLEREQATLAGCTEAILLDTDGFLAEGSASNLFFAVDGILCTPAVSCGILPGIIRSFVMKNFPVREERFMPEDLMRADECFLTNSLMGILGIREMQNRRTWPIGPLTRLVQDAYLQEIS